MPFDSRIFRSFVAAFTGVWTSVLCCCTVIGHPTAAAAGDAQTTATTAPVEDASHSCCTAAAEPAAPEPAEHHDQSHHDGCDCPHKSTLKTSQTEHNTLPPTTVQPPMPDLAPPALYSIITPAASGPPAIHQALAPPVLPCAHSLLQQSCLLTT